MVVNEPTASRTAFLRRMVVSQLTVDKLKKELQREVPERSWQSKRGLRTGDRDGIGSVEALRNLRPRLLSMAARVSQARISHGGGPLQSPADDCLLMIAC